MNKPLVLADYHHGGLYYSLQLLFEQRMGGTLVRPIGYEWFKKGFWKYSEQLGVIKQYLELPSKELLRDGVYHIPSLEGSVNYIQKAVTFEKFLELDFDFIIASVQNHEKSFHTLIQEHKPDAVLIRQLGTSYELCDSSLSRNILNSTTKPVPPGLNMVHYHPEFSVEDFHYTPPKTHNVIRNLMHCLPVSVDKLLWYEYKKAMPDFTWKMHGALGDDGILLEHMKARGTINSSFIWHVKWAGDGYGFNIHQAYACGRPCIVRGKYYENKQGGLLFEDGVTCIDLDRDTMENNIKKIRHFARSENHLEMCENAYKRFKKVVDFDKEFKQIRKFLERAKA